MYQEKPLNSWGTPSFGKDKFSCPSSPVPQPLTQTPFLLSFEQRCRDDPMCQMLGEGGSAGEILSPGVWVTGAGDADGRGYEVGIAPPPL